MHAYRNRLSHFEVNLCAVIYFSLRCYYYATITLHSYATHHELRILYETYTRGIGTLNEEREESTMK